MTTDKPKRYQEARKFVLQVIMLLIAIGIAKAIAGNAGVTCFAFGVLAEMVMSEFDL